MAVVSRVTGAALLVGVTSYSILKSRRVYAQSVKIHPRELDIYAEPTLPSAEDDEAEEDLSALERHISMVRKKSCKVWGSFKGTRQSVGEAFSTGKSKATDFAELLQTDQTFQLKVGAITASTITGFVLAGRGRRPLRRLLLGSALGLTAASICYPNVAVETSLRSYNKIKEAAIKQWEAYKSKAPEPVAEKPIAEDTKPEVETALETAEQVNKDIVEKEEAVTDHEPAEASKEEATSEEILPAVVEEEVKVVEVDQSKSETEVAPTENAEKEVSGGEASEPHQDKPAEVHVPWYNKIVQSFKGKPEPELAPEEKSAPPVVEVEATPIPNENSVPPAQEEVLVAPVVAKIEGDPGMSETEDQDMYSTRS